MSAFISRKKSLLILLISLFTAAAVVVLLNLLLSGPRLGREYDFLLGLRSAPPLARDILLIDTEEIIEPGDLAGALITMSEMDAAAMILQVPVLGFSSARSGSTEEILRRFNDEFNLLGRNIRNLFEAIRVGSIAPGETSHYVENLVELTERGKERLTSALIQKDEAGTVQVERAAAAFGRVFRAGDLRVNEEQEETESRLVSRPRPDRDGKLRRLYPVQDETLNVVYAALKNRWESSEIEYTEHGPVLANRNSDNATTLIIPLDSAGGILFETLHRDQNFRHIPLTSFREYEDADRDLFSALKSAESKGVYSSLAPENMPVFLHEYAQSLREEFLSDPDDEKQAAWLSLRAEYFKSLSVFLDGPSETNLVSGYEEIIATEKLSAEGSARLVLLRDELIKTFAELREKHLVLLNLRSSLNEALSSSFCIMGPPLAVSASALFANVLYSGHFIQPGQTRYILFWSLVFVLLILVSIHRLRPPAGFITGFIISLLCSAGFSWSFIISGYWIDPFIPAAGSLAGTIIMFTISAGIIRRGAQRFRLAYGPQICKPYLKELIRTGRPATNESIPAQAAIITIRGNDLLACEDKKNPAIAAKVIGDFRKRAAEKIIKAGAVVLGYEADMVSGCFGSPLERTCVKSMKHESPYADDSKSPGNPASRACGFITELLKENETADAWRFGIDYGECVFAWTERTGYTAVGRAVVRSRILSGLAARYHAKVLVSDAVQERINLPVRKLQTLGGKDESGRESFYELTGFAKANVRAYP